MTDYNTSDARNIDRVEDQIIAIKEAEKATRTPFGADRTAELDIQFSIDPSFGLTKERYGWYSNNNLFDSTHFSQTRGTIDIETGAVGTDTARIRSAYPGQYYSHTLAVPGVGLIIPPEYLEDNQLGNPSLTHGEISAEVVEWDPVSASGINAIGLSFEDDGVYVQVRRNDEDVAFVRQEDWNLDTMDGQGPSGRVLDPAKGYVYNFEYTWYGQGAIVITIQDSETGSQIPVHRVDIDGNPPTDTPNMPVQVTVENQGTADPLGCRVGGIQFATHGGQNISDNESGRTTEIIRQTGASYIDQNVVLDGNSPDPFAEPGVPLIAVQRELGDLISRRSLAVEVINVFANTGGDVYMFIFDEYEADAALTGANFQNPPTRGNGGQETRLTADISATEYTPQTATLRGLLYVSGDKNTADVITGDSSARLPMDATVVLTAALPPGSNSTYAQPAILEVLENW